MIRIARAGKSKITQQEIMTRIKKDMIETNLKKFGNASIGIHGHELPKFEEDKDKREFWKFSKSYRASPVHTSSLELNRSLKHCAKPEELLLCDAHNKPALPDSFKKTYIPVKRRGSITDKIQSIKHFNREESNLNNEFTYHGNSRWTDKIQIILQKRSIYDEEPTQRSSLLKYDNQPLPTSFNKTGIFEDPLEKLATK